MKKVVLALVLVVSSLAVSSVYAGCEYNACEQSCAPKCAKYKVIDESCECAPECERFVRVTEPAICIRSCRWVCPEGTQMSGAQVQGRFELVGGQNQHGN